jgi:hypothetical protein
MDGRQERGADIQQKKPSKRNRAARAVMARRKRLTADYRLPIRRTTPRFARIEAIALGEAHAWFDDREFSAKAENSPRVCVCLARQSIVFEWIFSGFLFLRLSTKKSLPELEGSGRLQSAVRPHAAFYLR